MPDTIAIAQGAFQGIPVTKPIADSWQAHEALTYMTITYPGEMFTIESQIDDDDRTMVITWIPRFYVNQFLNQMIATRVLTTTSWNW
jgi:hypothetical protein